MVPKIDLENLIKQCLRAFRANAPSLMTGPMVCSYTGLSRTHFNTLKASREFPNPVVVGGSKKWRKRDVDRWVDSLKPVEESE